MRIKLHTVNVIEMTDGNPQQLFAFADNPKGNKRAETVFRRLVSENQAGLRCFTSDDMNSFIEDGCYEAMTNLLALAEAWQLTEAELDLRQRVLQLAPQ